MKIIDINGNERECVSLGPDPNFPGYVKVAFKSKVRKGYVHSEWFPGADFVKLNPNHKDALEGLKAEVPDDLGVVSISTKTTLKDITKNWTKDLYEDFPVWISRGKGEGQHRIVVKNSHNTLTIDKPWDVNPDKTSQYVLSYNIQENPIALGNTLPTENTKKAMRDLVSKAKKSATNKQTVV